MFLLIFYPLKYFSHFRFVFFIIVIFNLILSLLESIFLVLYHDHESLLPTGDIITLKIPTFVQMPKCVSSYIILKMFAWLFLKKNK